jgi:ribonuclease BN (tRNA processing enzyme)
MEIRDLGEDKLSLTNDGRLSVFFVGCGSAFAKTLNQNNVLLVKGDTHILVDCGTKTPPALHRLGVPITDITHYLITHSHADHIGGLEEVMLMGRYVSRRKPTVVITKEYQDILWKMSLRGGAAFNERRNGSELTFGDFWEIERPKKLRKYPRDVFEIQVGSLNLKLVRTNHFPEQAKSWKEAFYSVGLILDDRVLFSGDTKFDANLVLDFEERFNFELIFHDAQFFTGGVHASLDELAELPKSVRSKMLLMHYPDSYQQQEDKVRELGFMGFVRQSAYYDFPTDNT